MPIDVPAKPGASNEADGGAVAANLRRRAEALYESGSTAPGEPPPSASDADTQRLLHELQVHQIELELQNTELIEARAKTEAALARYTDLYDFAPVGYFTLDPRGEVVEVNLTGARLLGLPRLQISGRRFNRFVVAGSIPAFTAFLARMFDGNAPGSSEVILDLAADGPKVARLEGIASEDRQTCRVVVSDITSQHRATEALRKFSRAIERTASSVMVTDTNGVIEYVNPGFCKSSGYRVAEAVGHRANLLKSGYTSQAEYRDLWCTISAGLVWRGEFRNRRKDGSLYWESAIISPITDELGSITHYVSVQDDISTRKAAEAESRASEARFRQLFDLAPIPLCRLSEDGSVIAVNRRFVEAFGYTHEDLRSLREWWQIAFPDPDYRHCVMSTWEGAVARAKQSGADIELAECQITCRGGEVRTLVVSGRILDDGIFVVLFDITERKCAEQALAQREAQNRAVIETTADGFWMVDREGMLLAVNDAYVRRSGYSREELLTMHARQLDAHDTADEVRGRIDKVMRGGSDFFETSHRTKDGQLWPVEVTVAYWASAGGRFFAFLRDISERRRNEAAIRALHLEMEHRNRAHIASQTVAALAHDLNQPLLAVAAYAEAALRLLRAGNPTPDKLRRALENSSLQAQRAGEAVRNLLNALRDSDGDGQFEAVNVNDLVSDAIAIVRRNTGSRFQAVLDLASDLAPVRADRLRIAKVLENLIQNGVEAMRDAGVSPSLLTIAARTAADGRMAHVTVRDSGPGLDAQTLRRIFDPFFSTKANGLGMGLPISRSIVEAHGGQLWVESDPGMGASFHFTLPFAQ